jgi:hypothetical protein
LVSGTKGRAFESPIARQGNSISEGPRGGLFFFAIKLISNLFSNPGKQYGGEREAFIVWWQTALNWVGFGLDL